MVVMKGVAVKENVRRGAPLAGWWVWAGAAAVLAALAGVARIDSALPAPLARHAAPAERFSGERAYEHLLNLTAIGPRVAGSYENEVAAVAALVAAARAVAGAASAHNRLQLDVHTASGGFPLAFLDGMNNVYRDVQSVVGRVSPAGGAGPRPRTALLLNCHFDTVPDSPGASDDGAGCAVVLEAARALAASGRPLRHDVVFLLNGAEENILQASHAFVTRHPWAASVRAFLNLEACGAGGREVLFQAGPRDPWLLEVYADQVPHPFASSLAQELFESGLIPADTDFRIFRDFGNLSGVDFAWSANGYVYHTRLDTAERVGAAALQRTGDNVLALVRGVLDGDWLRSAPEADARAPVFFDVLGAWVVCVRAPLAACAAVATLALAAAHAHRHQRAARRRLFVGARDWYALVGAACATWAAAHASGVAASAAVALLLHSAGAPLAYYSRPWLVVPLFAFPALAACWGAATVLWQRWGAGAGGAKGAAAAHGWWGARCVGCACVLAHAVALLICLLLRLRSGFLPLLWALLPAVATIAVPPGGWWATCWCLGAALPTLQTCYLALGSLQMFIPVMGRAGTPPLPADAMLAALVAVLTLSACGWMLPLVVATRRPWTPVCVLACACAVTVAIVCAQDTSAAYSELRPQRVMIFHVKRTIHSSVGTDEAREETFYWMPVLDANTPRALLPHVPALRALTPWAEEECSRLPYCGAPYYLPALSLIGASFRMPARTPPLGELRVRAYRERPSNGSAGETVVVEVGGGAAAHVVMVVAPAEGARVVWSSEVAAPLEGARWGTRRTYFFALHDARAHLGRGWRVALRLAGGGREGRALLALSAHAMSGERQRGPAHARLLRSLPRWAAATGWSVHMHLLAV